MQIGVYSFADTNQETGAGQRLRDLIEEIELADQVGLDVFGVGEHHRPDYAASAPAVVLGAAAARTKNIRLTSAVTVLSSDDPVRVFQEFSTVDLLSGRPRRDHGRPRIVHRIVSACSDTTSSDYDSLFAEKLELLLAMREKRAGDLAGQASRGDRGSRRLSTPRAASAAGVDRGRRDAGVGRARGDARASARARDNRRAAGKLRSVRRSVSRDRRAARASTRRS